MPTIAESLADRDKVVMLTAYDCSMARFCDAAGIDLILVGDSLAMVFQGASDTKSVTMDAMIYHTRAVCRGAGKTPVVGDMPIHSYDSPSDALANAQRFIEAGARAVKIEGNRPAIIQTLLEKDIPVMGHIGLLPQTAETFKVQGKDQASAEQLLRDACELDALGVFALVLECIPAALARTITAQTRSKTIGIGAGPDCDGQVLVCDDLLGVFETFQPKFVRRYAELAPVIRDAIAQYKKDVETGRFPQAEESYA